VILGKPNVGKSTLLNALLEQKIAIVSPKPETTRKRMLGILTLPEGQILFLDTPGVHRGPKTLLAKHQIQSARSALSEADGILMVIQSSDGWGDEDRQIVKLLPRVDRGAAPSEKAPTVPVILAINKADRVNKRLILPQIEEAGKLYPFREIVPISATRGENLKPLKEALLRMLPEGPPLYPANQLTDQPVRELAAEVIREKVLLFTHEEVPHAIAVQIEEWRTGAPSQREGTPEPAGKKHLYVRATLHVERDSQKGILIGKGGQALKRIGQAARKEIEHLAGSPIYLDLWVKVSQNWRKDPKILRNLGYSG